jgi:hypothetical protein
MKICFVDGYKIRQFLDVDFNSFHFQQKNPLNLDSKWYIPKGEAWCDVALKDEIDFFKKVELSSVDSRNEAIKKFKTKGKIPDFIVRKKKQKGVMVVYVNGSLVRQHIDPWFVCGGHGYVYAYVPKNEIWIDIKMDSRDVPHVLLHESIERELMKNNKKSYDTAHEYASVAEKESRQKAGGSYIGYADYPYEDFKKLIQSFYV